ncbi:serine hydrolase [Deinococcus sp. HMF7620]|uniref:Serine hydrolase n=1 Tax=Deinococcus arboris TaxID=2682977 RepID=A0A7C9M8Z7_9DEIO|nr:serine hydrolase [Deinococcus arboris]MVN87299.1 serine hydrolase [Deinococcus arboris]
MRPLSVLAAALTLTATAQAQTPAAVAQAVTRLLSGQTQEADFAPSFLAQVPFQALTLNLDALRTQYGAFVRVEEQGGTLRAVFERGALLLPSVSLDDQGRFVTLLFAPVPPSTAEAAGREAALRALFEVPLKTDLLTPEFLAAVPAAELSALLDSIRAESGTLQTVTIEGQGALLTFSDGTVRVTSLTLDPQGRIAGLLLAPPREAVSFASLEEARAAFAALPGQVSLLVQEVGGSGLAKPALTELNAGRPLAVASAFKLAVLGELQAQVQAGTRAWTDEITLQDADRVPSSAALEGAPVGSRFTLRDLAARMIAVSDNTATDLLLRAVGRAGVEARLGQAALPSTREAFALKNPANAELLRAYRAATLNPTARRAVLAQAATASLAGLEGWGNRPLALDVEWFVSARRLCTLMAGVSALPETQLNPGVASAADFRAVSYKGGSEPGVLNLTTQVTTQAGRTLCVTATWNAPQALNEERFTDLYGALLNLLR